MTKPYVQSGEPLHEFLHSFWQRQVDAAEQETPDYRHPPLPLARIKKVMKSDPDVKVLFFPLPSFSFLFNILPPHTDDRSRRFVHTVSLSITHILYYIVQPQFSSARLVKVRWFLPSIVPVHSSPVASKKKKKSLLQRLQPGRSLSLTQTNVVPYRVQTSQRR